MLLAVLVPWERGSDSKEYLALANALDMGLYGSVTAAGFEPEALRPPAYPAVIWLLVELLGLPLGAVIGVQLLLYLCCLVALSRWLKVLRYGREAFLALNLIYVFPAIYISGIMTEAWAMAVMTATVLLAIKPPTTARLMTIGLVAGIGALFRPDLVLLPVAVAIALALTRGPALRLLIPVAVSGLMLLPFALYNKAYFGRLTPIPVASGTGNSLYMSTWQHRLSQDDLNSFYFKKPTPRTFELGLAQDVARLNAKIGADPYTAPWHPKGYPDRAREIRSSSVFRQAAKERIAADPTAYAAHVIGNVWNIWNTKTYPETLPWIGKLFLGFISGAMTILGLSGAAVTLLQPKSWPVPRAMALIFGYVPAVQIWFHGEGRYTSAVRPLLVLFAVVLIHQLVTRLLARNSPAAT